jgi:hypothetical protein
MTEEGMLPADGPENTMKAEMKQPTQEQYENFWLWMICRHKQPSNESYSDYLFLSFREWYHPFPFQYKLTHAYTMLCLSKQDGTLRMHTKHFGTEAGEFWPTCEVLGIDPGKVPNLADFMPFGKWTYKESRIPTEWVYWLKRYHLDGMPNARIKAVVKDEIDRVMKAYPNVKRQIARDLLEKFI